MKKFILITLGAFVFIIGLTLLFLVTGIIWKSPARYVTTRPYSFQTPVMGMTEYGQLPKDHERPYIYSLKQGKGSAIILGIDHTKNPEDHQVDSIEKYWQQAKPTIALVEGRLGFLMQGIQDPVATHGEGGKLVSLAKKDLIPYYSWEPAREEEVKELLKKYPPKKLALFYTLRPYFSNFRFGRPSDPDATIQKYIDERTSVKGLKGELHSVKQIDSIWARDFSSLDNWRNTSDQYGWPEGYLSDIFNASNLYRDYHLCSMIMELMEKGERVVVTMGSSHAFRIRRSLENKLK